MQPDVVQQKQTFLTDGMQQAQLFAKFADRLHCFLNRLTQLLTAGKCRSYIVNILLIQQRCYDNHFPVRNIQREGGNQQLCVVICMALDILHGEYLQPYIRMKAFLNTRGQHGADTDSTRTHNTDESHGDELQYAAYAPVMPRYAW